MRIRTFEFDRFGQNGIQAVRPRAREGWRASRAGAFDSFGLSDLAGALTTPADPGRLEHLAADFKTGSYSAPRELAGRIVDYYLAFTGWPGL